MCFGSAAALLEIELYELVGDCCRREHSEISEEQRDVFCSNTNRSLSEAIIIIDNDLL